MKVIPETHIAH